MTIRFPVFQRLDIDEYQLYPGVPDSPGLHLDFTPGPWIVLGVNGLGKSTLLLILKHVLTGPARIRGAGFTGDRSDVLPVDPRFFAVRVGDNAHAAVATTEVRFGSAVLKVRRRLSDLGLVEATVRGIDPVEQVGDEESYRALIAKIMGLSRFEDALRVLDRVTFYLEAREPLLWNLAAQFELFRAILTPDKSEELRRLEGDIVSADSSARNLNAVLYKLVNRRDTQQAKQDSAAETRARLAKATAEVESSEAEEIKLQHALEAAEERRSDARVELKRADRAADEAAQKYEEIKFEVLRHAFAGVSPNEQYVFLKIISERVCLACGNGAEAAAEELERRRSENRCLVCGSQRHSQDKVVSTTSAMQAKAAEAFTALQTAREALQDAGEKYRASEQHYRSVEDNLEIVRRRVDASKRDARRWRSKLPAQDQAALARDEDRIETLRREVLNFRKERDDAEEKIAILLSELKAATESIRENLEDKFQTHAQDFFAEKVRLVYAPRKDRIGQGGRVFEFPAFEIELTSGATGGNFVRRSASQVSLSQREYLDLIFRMSLVETFGSASGSFVVDGPEGSVDAVFAEKAGNLFSALAKRTSGLTVILACNIVDGAFIPHTLRAYKTPDARSGRVVNLIDLAAPTAALVALQNEYRFAVDKILAQDAR
ncbi:seryl-tRNA synthetase [Azospirillum fermentarium]|uniref:hypothetical protein n=1 Tax=Azospirillum fermentarium TaxID=1233114 RepID=UPI002225CF03|nr:hypothetical protein [Azospirillum fermentarium]MCW2249304.1 seryl-tRNA synthetase [Azospirillum fermentarium]